VLAPERRPWALFRRKDVADPSESTAPEKKSVGADGVKRASGANA
jgi:hypothetical protein